MKKSFIKQTSEGVQIIPKKELNPTIIEVINFGEHQAKLQLTVTEVENTQKAINHLSHQVFSLALSDNDRQSVRQLTDQLDKLLGEIENKTKRELYTAKTEIYAKLEKVLENQ